MNSKEIEIFIERFSKRENLSGEQAKTKKSIHKILSSKESKPGSVRNYIQRFFNSLKQKGSPIYNIPLPVDDSVPAKHDLSMDRFSDEQKEEMKSLASNLKKKTSPEGIADPKIKMSKELMQQIPGYKGMSQEDIIEKKKSRRKLVKDSHNDFANMFPPEDFTYAFFGSFLNFCKGEYNVLPGDVDADGDIEEFGYFFDRLRAGYKEKRDAKEGLKMSNPRLTGTKLVAGNYVNLFKEDLSTIFKSSKSTNDIISDLNNLLAQEKYKDFRGALRLQRDSVDTSTGFSLESEIYFNYDGKGLTQLGKRKSAMTKIERDTLWIDSGEKDENGESIKRRYLNTRAQTQMYIQNLYTESTENSADAYAKTGKGATFKGMKAAGRILKIAQLNKGLSADMIIPMMLKVRQRYLDNMLDIADIPSHLESWFHSREEALNNIKNMLYASPATDIAPLLLIISTLEQKYLTKEETETLFEKIGYNNKDIKDIIIENKNIFLNEQQILDIEAMSKENLDPYVYTAVSKNNFYRSLGFDKASVSWFKRKRTKISLNDRRATLRSLMIGVMRTIEIKTKGDTPNGFSLIQEKLQEAWEKRSISALEEAEILLRKNKKIKFSGFVKRAFKKIDKELKELQTDELLDIPQTTEDFLKENPDFKVNEDKTIIRKLKNFYEVRALVKEKPDMIKEADAYLKKTEEFKSLPKDEPIPADTLIQEMEKMMKEIGEIYKETMIYQQSGYKNDELHQKVKGNPDKLLAMGCKISNLITISLRSDSMEDFAVYYAALDLRNQYYLPTIEKLNRIK